MASSLSAQPRPYEYVSLFSLPAFQNTFQANPPSINNNGTVAFVVPGTWYPEAELTGQALVFDHGGRQVIFDLGEVSSKCCGMVKINDNQVVAVRDTYSFYVGGIGGIYLIGESPAQMIVSQHTDGVSGDFKEIRNIDINNHNVVAAIVTLNSGIPAVIKADANGYTIIDVQDVNVRFNFYGVSINDAGIVAYRAQEPTAQPGYGPVSVFTGDGINPVQKALPLPADGNVGTGPALNNFNEVAASTVGSLVIGTDGSIVDTIVDGANSPFPPGDGPTIMAMNNSADVVFQASTIFSGSGLYFGDDAVDDKLIQSGDSLFGGIVGGPSQRGDAVRFVGVKQFNDIGQVVFIVTVQDDFGNPTSHIVRADPIGGTPDSDGDGVPDDQDICPGGDDNVDTDGDFVPDACDTCPNDPNNDADGDGVCGDVDVCVGGDDNLDMDFDGTPDACDVCPVDPLNDADGDGICEVDDNCEAEWNPAQTDTDSDGFGDACDTDIDNDGVPNGEDNCLYDANPGQEDFDQDGAGDACDTDSDGDGINDSIDECLNTLPDDVVNQSGCSIADLVPCEHASSDIKWKNHGAYVRNVAHVSQGFVDAGLISEAEKDTVVSSSGQTQCGVKD
jgi:hypothetical protein